MKLDDVEKLAKYVTDSSGFVPRINAAVDLATLARAVLAMLPLVRAAALWQHGVVTMPDGSLVDADDGSAEQGMSRPPAAQVLLAAIDTMRAAIGEKL